MKNKIKRILSNFPRIYISIANLKHRNSDFKKHIINKNTDILIEGFPRSGNSFVSQVFKKSNKNIKVATHLHSPAHVIRACQLNIPCLILIRNPKDAIVSLKAFEIYLNSSKIPIKEYIKNYINFYKKIIPYKKKIVIGEFEKITKNIDKTILRLNEKFNKNFNTFNHTKEKGGEIFKKSSHIGPNKEREKHKEKIYNLLESSKYEKLLTKANNYYENFIL